MSRLERRVSATMVGGITGLIWLIANLDGAEAFRQAAAWCDLAPVAGVLGLAAATLALTVSRAPTPFRRGALCIVGVGLAALALKDPFSGPWIRGTSWGPWAHGAALVGVALALVFAVRRVDGWSRARLAALFLLLGTAAWWLDARVLRGHYGSFHLALWLVFSVLPAWAVAMVAPPFPRKLTVAGSLILVALSARCVLAPPLASPERADLLLRRAPGARLLLGRLPARWLGASSRNERAVDDVLEARLTARAWVDADALDARFPGRDTWDLVLVTLDTLRPDRMGLYGRAETATPHIDAFARKGLVFDNAYAAFPSSLLGLTALFTGRAPTATRFFRSGGAEGGGGASYDEVTLTNTVLRHGFHTAAVTSFPTEFLARLAGHFHEDFQSRVNTSLPEGEETREVVRQALRVLEAPREGRLFLWVHLFAPHAPYRSFRDSPFGDRRPIDRYDGEIHHMDKEMKPLLDFLDRRVREGRALVVIHSDHGEEFGEHGGSAHHSSLYEEQIRVPLAIRAPTLAPGRAPCLAELMDLPATLTEWLGVPWSGRGLGRSLLPRILEGSIPDSARHPAPDVAFFQFRHPGRTNGVLDGIRKGDWKLIADRRWNLWELYDLDADPGEKVNLGPRSSPRLGGLRPWLETLAHLAGDTGGSRTPRGELSARDALLDAYARGVPLPVPPTSSKLQGLAACLRGESEAADSLRRQMAGARGLDAVVAAAGLLVAGDETWREPLVDLVIGPFLPPTVDRFVLRALVEHGGEAALLPLYTRVLKGIPALEVLPMLRVALEGADPQEAAPLVRILLGSEDKGIREFATDVAERWGWGESIPLARKVEGVLQGARQVAMREDGIPLAEKAHRTAITLMGSMGVLDWGAVFEHLYFMGALGQRPRAGRNLRTWIAEVPSSQGLPAESLNRALTIAATDARPSRVTVEGPHEVLRPKGTPWLVIPVTVAVASSSRALLGGELRGVDYLVWQALDDKGAPIGNPVLHPLPVKGILPGVTRKVFMLLPGDSIPASTRRLALLVSRGTEPVCSPWFVNVRE